MLKVIIGGPVCDQKHRAGRRFYHRHPSPLFFAYISALIGVLEKLQVITNKRKIVVTCFAHFLSPRSLISSN